MKIIQIQVLFCMFWEADFRIIVYQKKKYNIAPIIPNWASSG